MKQGNWLYGRRAFMTGAAMAGGAGLILPSALIAATPVGGADNLIVETAHGRLRGRREGRVISFKGVPYGADTGGRNRFMAPQPVVRWAGVRDAFEFGPRCPQVQERLAPSRPANSSVSYGENCLVLNIYTTELGTRGRRPVMFWIHGGGFRSGSGDTPETDGTNLAQFGDVVVVTVNHRLNLFGYSNLSHLSADFTDAANVGQLDLIAALAWVRDNIAAFGGDPHRVTLFGESGGGAKIAALSVMPAAGGHFHRSINMSGPGAFFLTPSAEAEPSTNELLKVLGISRSDPRQLQHIPADQLLAAHNKALANIGADQPRPTIDGRHIPFGTMSAQGMAMQAELPVIMTYCATEATPWLLSDRRNLEIDAGQLQSRIMAQFGIEQARALQVIDAYRQDGLSRTPWDILVSITSDAMIRTPMRHAAEARAKVGKAPVYLGNFGWKSPVEGGIWGGPHAIDVPFAFGNVGQSRLTAAPNQQAFDASKNMMAAYSSFAASGSPDNAHMPRWAPHELASRPTMVIDDTCRLVNDLRAGDRQASEMLPVQQTFQITNGALVHGVNS